MDDPRKALANRLAWDLDSRISLEVKVTSTDGPSRIVSPTPVASSTMREHYIERASGGRFYERLFLNGDQVTFRTVNYSDGTRCARLSFDPKDAEQQTNIVITREFGMETGNDRRDLPFPLLCYYVGREPLDESLPRGEWVGKETVMDRPCDIILFRQVKWAVPQDQVYFVDKATAVPLKIEAFADDAARSNQKPIWTWTVSKLEEIDGRSVPVESRLIGKSPDGAVFQDWILHIDEIAFNKTYAASTFWPVYQPQAMVVDNIKQSVIEPKLQPVAQPVPATAKAIEAVPPADWFSAASPLALGLGVAVLLVAGVMLWRRR